MEILLLTTPAQHQSINPSVELNPKRLQQWIASLPAGDVIATVKHLHGALCAFNEMPLDSAERFKLLEIYHGAFEHIVRNYDDMRIRQLRISPAQKASLAEDIMWLYLELSQGYKIVVKDGYENNTSSLGDGVMAASIFRALELISFGLLYAYRLQASTPPLAFLELYQLFSLAERLGIQDKRIRVAKGYAKTPSIADLFKLILLISVADPYKLDSLKIEPLYHALQPFAQACLISATALSDNAQFHYFIHLLEDTPPVGGNNTGTTEGVRFINIYPALKDVQVWLEKHGQSDTKFLYEQELQLLGDFLRQFFPETDIELPPHVQVVSGMENCHKLLSTMDKDLVTVYREPLPMWTVIEKLNDGCKIKGEINADSISSTGELLTLLAQDDKSEKIRLIVAITKKSEQMSDNQYSLELKYVSQHAVPIKYTVAIDGNTSTETHCGLYIPKELKTNPHATLIVERRHYLGQQQYGIRAGSHFYTVRSKDAVHNTPRYTTFRFTVVADDRKAS